MVCLSLEVIWCDRSDSSRLVYFFIFETKDKSLEKMDELFGDKVEIDEMSSSSHSSNTNLPATDKEVMATSAEENTVAA
jgi:hypothetical protein